MRAEAPDAEAPCWGEEHKVGSLCRTAMSFLGLRPHIFNVSGVGELEGARFFQNSRA